MMDIQKVFQKGLREKNNLQVRFSIGKCDLLGTSTSYLVDSNCQFKKVPFY